VELFFLRKSEKFEKKFQAVLASQLALGILQWDCPLLAKFGLSILQLALICEWQKMLSFEENFALGWPSQVP